MVDMAVITAFFKGIESTISIVRSINTTVSSIKNAELKNQVADLMGLLADQKMQSAEIKNIIFAKDQEIAELKKKLEELASSDKPIYQDGFYRFKDDNSDYCTRCWDDKMKKFRVTGTLIPNNFQCPQCKSYFKKSR